MYSRAMAVALVLILGITLSEVDAMAISDQRKEFHFPDTIMTCINDYVKSFAPTIGRFIDEIGQSYYVTKLRVELNDIAQNVTEFMKAFDQEMTKELDKEEQKKKKKKHQKDHNEEQQQ